MHFCESVVRKCAIYVSFSVVHKELYLGPFRHQALARDPPEVDLRHPLIQARHAVGLNTVCLFLSTGIVYCGHSSFPLYWMVIPCEMKHARSNVSVQRDSRSLCLPLVANHLIILSTLVYNACTWSRYHRTVDLFLFASPWIDHTEIVLLLLVIIHVNLDYR